MIPGMAGRRANGDGTRARERKDGRWEVKVSVPRPEGGTQRVTVYGKTSTDAVNAARAELNKHESAGGYKKPERKTLGAFLDQWISDVVTGSARATTLRSYTGIVTNHLKSSIGHIPLMKLTPPMVARALSADGEDAAPARTRQLAYDVLRAALNVAVKWELARVNVTSGVPRPRVSKKEIKFLTAPEVTEILAHCEKDRLRAFYLLAIFTGLRPGEIYALQWSEVDLQGCSIRVTHTLDPKTLTREEVKTPRGRRTVDISPTVANSLMAHRTRMLAEGRPHGLVFPDTIGGPLRESNFARNHWKPLLAQTWGGTTIPAPTRARPKQTRTVPDRDHKLYDLRHTAATLMIAAGVHVKVISERMGHASVAFTLDTYGHLLPTLGKDAALALDQFLATG